MSSAPASPSARVHCQSSKCATLFDRAKQFLETGLYADCEFFVGPDGCNQQVNINKLNYLSKLYEICHGEITGIFIQVFKVYKAFLAHASPTFHAMVFGEMGQAALRGEYNLSSPKNGVIAVPDVTPKTFRDLME